jgi:hypothetical protein
VGRESCEPWPIALSVISDAIAKLFDLLPNYKPNNRLLAIKIVRAPLLSAGVL